MLLVAGARPTSALPSAAALLVAFVTSLLFFLQLRIADEFKDYEDDARYRPYRPVPRGLVTLRELALGRRRRARRSSSRWRSGCEPSHRLLLAIAWVYLALMTREFFVAALAEAHPVVYMASHMVIMPLIDLYATACDWWVAGLVSRRPGLFWFLIVSYLNGIVIEIGRKTRAPADEEHGVETYSALWGRTAPSARGCRAVLHHGASRRGRQPRESAPRCRCSLLLAVLVAACGAVAFRVVRRRAPGSGKSIELMSGVWTVLMYLGLGAVPLAYRLWR